NVDGHERVIAQVDVVTVAVAVDALAAVGIGPGVPVAVARPGADERGQQDHRCAQVVLDRIGEEDGPEEQAGEGESVSDPVGAATNLRLLDQLDEAMDDGDDRDGADDKRRDEDSVEDDAPGEAAETAPRARPWCMRRIVSLRGHREPSSKKSAALSSALSNRRCPPG